MRTTEDHDSGGGAGGGGRASRGQHGYRGGTTAEPQYTAQLNASVTPAMRARFEALHGSRRPRVSQATVLREVLEIGLSSLEGAAEGA